MYFIASIIDFLIVLLLLRFLIKPNEAYFHPIYKIIYRITDFLLIPANYVTQSQTQKILAVTISLVVIRGALYAAIVTQLSFMGGVGKSMLDLIQFLFQAYIVILIISILSQPGYGTSFMSMVERALLPFYKITRQFKLQRNLFYFVVFISLLAIYSFSSFFIYSFMIDQTGSAAALIFGVAESLILVLALFPFPGFFSLVIVIGALLSWVSPDQSNPVVQTIYGISEPILSPFRKVIPLLGGIDLSPIVALLCFNILGQTGIEIIKRLV